MSDLYSTGAIDILESHSMSPLELALLSFACEYPHTIEGLTAWFSRWPKDYGYIDYPHYLPVENVSPATVERAVARLLDRSIIGMADEQFIDSVRVRLAEGGLFSGLVSPPETNDVVPLSLGVSIYKQIGRRLNWVWDVHCGASKWCVMTCSSVVNDGHLFPRWSHIDSDGVTIDNECVARQVRLVGKWYSCWWNAHHQGYAILSRMAQPDDEWLGIIVHDTAPEVKMWRRDILFDDNCRPGMSPRW